MIKRQTIASYIYIILLLLTMTFLVGCKDRVQTDSPKERKVKAVATIFPQYDFLRQIGGDYLDLTMLLSPGAESHSFEPTPGDMITVSECDLFVYVGGDSDAWVDTILDSVDTSGKKIVTLMDCVETLEEETVEGMQTHADHDHDAASHKSHEEHTADEQQRESDHHDGEQDEHVWTSPQNAILIVNKLLDALCQIDPEHAPEYEHNAADYIRKLQDLDQEFQTVAEQASTRTIIFGDRFAFRYLADAYGLSYYAAFPGCSSESEASIKTIAFLIDKVNDEQIPVVFHAELSNEKMTDCICEATGAKKLLLHSCHNLTKNEFNEGDTYLSLMEQNVTALKEALN